MNIFLWRKLTYTSVDKKPKAFLTWISIICSGSLLLLLSQFLIHTSTNSVRHVSLQAHGPFYPLLIQHPIPEELSQVNHEKLQELEAQIPLLKKQGVAVEAYKARIQGYLIAFRHTLTLEAAQQLSSTLDSDLESTQTLVAGKEARKNLEHFQQEIIDWGNKHAYYNQYDGRYYRLDAAYQASGAELAQALSLAQTLSAYTDLMQETNEAFFQLHLLEQDTQDNTPYDHPHSSDQQLLQHAHLQKGQTIVVSLAEQVMRVYQDGKLQRAMYVTTGRQELPSPPGIWPVLQRRSPIIFQATASANSPYWFPNTPIHYAILYRFGGYFIHDASWRGSFGPGTQFPHQDLAGNTPFNENGSHGCINISLVDADWLYQHSDINATVAIY